MKCCSWDKIWPIPLPGILLPSCDCPPRNAIVLTSGKEHGADSSTAGFILHWPFTCFSEKITNISCKQANWEKNNQCQNTIKWFVSFLIYIWFYFLKQGLNQTYDSNLNLYGKFCYEIFCLKTEIAYGTFCKKSLQLTFFYWNKISLFY